MHKSLKQIDDTHGTTFREEMMRSMERPAKPAARTEWKAYNRREKPRFDWMSWAFGAVLVALVVTTILAQIKMRFVP